MEENFMPQLTLDPFGTEQQPVATVVEKEEIKQVVTAEMRAKANLTPAERKVVSDFASKIDLTNSNVVLQYGAGAQTKIANFSESALANVRTKDLGEIGEMMTSLIGQLKSFDDDEEKGGFLGFFKKSSNKLATMKSRYDKAEVSVNNIAKQLQDHQIALLKDVAMLDKMYELNEQNFKELSMYILAGKEKLEQARNVELPALIAKAEASGLPEDSQRANDFANLCDRFEKKIYDLELTRTVAIQMAPQIRLIQNNDTVMAEKIQSTIVNTIPLWKNQMVLALGITHSQQAMEAQRAVTDMTNQMLKKNADTLKMGTIETAKEAERGIVDIETLQHTNRSLIETLDEVMAIQNEGRARRQEAEVELAQLENELRSKMLEIKSSVPQQNMNQQR